MLIRSALLVVALTSSAQAAAFDDLKGYLATCLRFELKGPAAPHGAAASMQMRYALDRCADDVARLDRADGRRLRSDGGISPSTREVIQAVVARSGSGGIANVRY